MRRQSLTNHARQIEGRKAIYTIWDSVERARTASGFSVYALTSLQILIKNNLTGAAATIWPDGSVDLGNGERTENPRQVERFLNL
jgi:hypothetical protein